jgi:predicted naringenin-chalcone synthase
VPATGTSIVSIGRATPALRVTQEQSLEYAGYSGDRIRRIFLNAGIAYRHFYFEQPPRPDETSDELNRRYLDGAMDTGCRAVHGCLEAAGLSARNVDLLVAAAHRHGLTSRQIGACPGKPKLPRPAGEETPRGSITASGADVLTSGPG